MKKRPIYTIPLIILVLILILSASKMFVAVQTGERGVISRKFTTGLDKKNIFNPGLHIIAPWNKLHIYDVKEQKSVETIDVLDKNGLSVNIDISVQFNPVYDKIGYLHENYSKYYVDKLVIPKIKSSVRQIAVRYNAVEIYSVPSRRREFESAIITETTLTLKENYIDMKAFVIRSVNLPPKIKEALENKIRANQELLKYKLQKETSKTN